MIVNYSVVMYEIGLAMFTRRSFVKIWNALQDYDDNVRQLGHPRKETRTAIVAWCLAIVITVIWSAVNYSGMYAFMETWVYNMRYMLPYIGTSMAVYKFMAMALFLGQRFLHLNVIAIKNLPSTTSSTGRSGNTAKISRKVVDQACYAYVDHDFIQWWS